MLESIKKKIEQMVFPVIEELNLDLVEVAVKRRGRTIAIEVLTDKKEGGITLDLCSQLNRLIAKKLELEPFIEGDYILEVSSPGLDRPLKTYKDFLRAVGKRVRFHLREPVENKLEHSGIIEEVSEWGVTIQGKSNTVQIPIDKIVKAVQIIEA